jgi:ribosomal protein S6
MKKIATTNDYESLLILPLKTDLDALKKQVFIYTKKLKNLGAFNISVISKGCKEFSYPVKGYISGHYIECYFSTLPESISLYANFLKLDKNIIKFLILKI